MNRQAKRSVPKSLALAVGIATVLGFGTGAAPASARDWHQGRGHHAEYRHSYHGPRYAVRDHRRVVVRDRYRAPRGYYAPPTYYAPPGYYAPPAYYYGNSPSVNFGVSLGF